MMVLHGVSNAIHRPHDLFYHQCRRYFVSCRRVLDPILFRHESSESTRTPLEDITSLPSNGEFFNTNRATWQQHTIRSTSPSVGGPASFSVPDEFFHDDLFSVSDIVITVHDVPFAISEFADCVSFSQNTGDESFVTAGVRVVIGDTVATACRNSLPLSKAVI